MASVVEDDKLTETNRHFLKHTLTAEFYSAISPAASRYFVHKANELQDDSGLSNLIESKNLPSYSTCPFCGTILTAENLRIRIKPRMRLQETALLKRLLRKQAEGQKLGRMQQSLLDRDQKSAIKLAMKCLSCSRSWATPMGTKKWRLKQQEQKSILKEAPMTVTERKKLKKKKKKRLKKTLEDSTGIISIHRKMSLAAPVAVDDSLQSNRHSTTSENTSASTLQCNSGNSGKKKETTTSLPSTSKVTNMVPNSLPLPSSQSKDVNKNRKKKLSSKNNILQKMLNQHQNERKRQSNSLGDFLSSI